MTLYPEVQRKAQEEVDSVVGRDRLPTASDRDLLPYVNALCNELFRWLPVAPLSTYSRIDSSQRRLKLPIIAIPRCLMDNDTYEGHFLEKGTIFVPNLWYAFPEAVLGFAYELTSYVRRSMLHDSETYERPMEFMPERFLATPNKPAEQDPHTIAFGFGRRYVLIVFRRWNTC